MENGLVSPSVEGTPQGGPLSPLLSNLVLDELDRELERRGHRFVRMRTIVISTSQRAAGQRVMESVTQFITQKLKLKVNEAKSAVARPRSESFSGSASRLVRRSNGSLRQGLGSVQAAHPGDHATGKGRQHGEDDGGTGSVYAGLAQLFRILRNAEVLIGLTRWVRCDSGGFVAAVENTPPSPGDLRKLGVLEPLAGSTAASSRGPWHLHGPRLYAWAFECPLQIARTAVIIRGMLA